MNTLYLFLKKIITSHKLYNDAKKKQNVYKVIEQEKNPKKVNNIYKTRQKIYSEYNKEIKTNNTVKITFYINLLGSINKLGILTQSNRILYVLSGVSSIINFDFNIYRFSDKLTTLSFDIDKSGKNIKLETTFKNK